MPTDKNKNLTDKVKEIKVTDSNQFLARKLLLQEIKDSKDSKDSIKKNANGGEIKPIKAVLGVAVLATKKGKDTLKKFLKGKKEIASVSPGMAAVPTTMNKGGGMDMGHKPRPRGNPGIVENVVGKGGDYIKDLID